MPKIAAPFVYPPGISNEPKMQTKNIELPIDKQQRVIEEAIARNPVTIITAETGAGKSTRVPLWLWKKGKRVVVTQPRRIAARSLSHYLAGLAGVVLGEAIGYQTGFESKVSKKTSLLYVTDGVQMIREINGRCDYDVLILDEAHEWNLNQEVLVGLVKKSLKKGQFRNSDKRVVIMSATLQAGQLARFLLDAPVIAVPGRGFPVEMHHNDPRFLLPDTAQMVELGRNVLVFQPGKQEIMTFSDDLKRMLDMEKLKAKILPLHAELTLKEQTKVFEHYGMPKVVVATDIAQTSLTIDDIDGVVDCGIKKEVRIVKGIEGLYPVDISEAECLQRAGRAGRVREGHYFLCADKGLKERLAFPEPEIQRLNLESVVLRLFKMGVSPLDFPFFHPPSKALVFKAIKRLKLLGAIQDTGDVTPDGHKMADFPVSMRSARMLLEAQKTNPRVLDSAIKCIAILETKGIAAKDCGSEKYLSSPFHSDVLNQLALWEMANRFKKNINWKKFVLAKEIYAELNKRLGIKEPPHGHLGSKDLPALYRAVLSSFADEVYERGGDEYLQENEIRQLERDSVLQEAKPPMIAGLPFDLVITRENANTGDKEELFIPLLTFASEITLELLEELKPFSFYKIENVNIVKSKISVFRQYYFGGRLIREFSSPPRWEIEEERRRVVPEVIHWLEENGGRYEDLSVRINRLRTDWEAAGAALNREMKSFDFYWRKFLFTELDAQLRLDDLDLFFNFHSGLKVLHLGKILPPEIIRELQAAEWPKFQVAGGEPMEVIYAGGRASMHFDFAAFERVTEAELILSTGEGAEIFLEGNPYEQWRDAVAAFNEWKRKDFYERKFRELLRPANMDDLLEIPFPQEFEGLRGKDNIPLMYYIVPRMEGDEAFLSHYSQREEAEAAFALINNEWRDFCKRYKSRKIQDIFKSKGWKVKP